MRVGDEDCFTAGVLCFLLLQSPPLWQKVLQSIPFFLHGHYHVLQAPEQLHLLQ